MLSFFRLVGRMFVKAPPADSTYDTINKMAGVIASISEIQLGIAGYADTYSWTPDIRRTVLGFVGGLSEKYAHELHLDEVVLRLVALDAVLKQDAITSGLQEEFKKLQSTSDPNFIAGQQAGYKDYDRFAQNLPCIGLIDCLGVA